MRKKNTWFVLYIVVLVGTLGMIRWISEVATVMAVSEFERSRVNLIIDPGHGGIDGGTSTKSGTLESTINLQIALRLEDLSHLLGFQTTMTRREDTSIYKEGQTIAQKKVSDLKERVKIANGIENGILLSIHQNYFPDDQYSGAQVFYGKGEGSEALAKMIQGALVKNLNIGSKRKCKAGTGIYLMEHTECPGVLIECGFLSNQNEAKLLQAKEYQEKLCKTIIATVSCYISGVDSGTNRWYNSNKQVK